MNQATTRQHRNRSNNKNRRSTRPRAEIHASQFSDELRLRGTAPQLAEKYEAMAREADCEKRSVEAEALRQHADHWRRIAMES